MLGIKLRQACILRTFNNRFLQIALLSTVLAFEVYGDETKRTAISLTWSSQGECRVKTNLPRLRQNGESVGALKLLIPDTYKDKISISQLSQDQEHLTLTLSTRANRGTAHMYFQAPVEVEVITDYEQMKANSLEGQAAVTTYSKNGYVDKHATVELSKSQSTKPVASELRAATFLNNHRLTPELLLGPSVTFTTIDLLGAEPPLPRHRPSVPNSALNAFLGGGSNTSTDVTIESLTEHFEQNFSINPDAAEIAESTGTTTTDETISEESSPAAVDENLLVAKIKEQALTIDGVMNTLKAAGLPFISYIPLSSPTLQDSTYAFRIKAVTSEGQEGKELIIKVLRSDKDQCISELIGSKQSQRVQADTNHLPVIFHWRGQNVFISVQYAPETESFSLLQHHAEVHSFRSDDKTHILRHILKNLAGLYAQNLAPVRLSLDSILFRQEQKKPFLNPYTSSLLTDLTPQQLKENRGQIMVLYLALIFGPDFTSMTENNTNWRTELKSYMDRISTSETEVIDQIAQITPDKEFPKKLSEALRNTLTASVFTQKQYAAFTVIRNNARPKWRSAPGKSSWERTEPITTELVRQPLPLQPEVPLTTPNSIYKQGRI